MGNKRKPLIAVVDSWGGIDQAIEVQGAVTVDISPYSIKAQDAAEVMELVDGVVFTGGGDVDPWRYGADGRPETTGVSSVRDSGEFMLAEAAKQRRVPMLGICRGNQLLNVAFGGTLHQHIPHLGEKVEHGRGKEHPVRFTQKSELGRKLRRERVQATSIHHQAVARLGDGLVAVAWAKDGLIEAIESVRPKPYVLGVQFHPEMDWRDKNGRYARILFRHFVDMVVRYRRQDSRTTAERKSLVPFGVVEYTRSRDWVTTTTPATTHTQAGGCQFETEEEMLEDSWIHWPGSSSGERESGYPSERYYTDRLKELDSRCDYPPCSHPEFCRPEDGDCFNGWWALQNDGGERGCWDG